MQLTVVGLNHKSAPLDVRERLALPGEEAAHAASALVSTAAISEALAVSTCNRVELYLVGADGAQVADEACAFFARRAKVKAEELEQHLYVHQDVEAVRHIFRVTAALDSMVLGEPQIAGQVKQGYRYAHDVGAVGPWLDRTMRQAFSVAKRVRAETAIGQNAVSMAYLAVELARQIFGKLEDKRGLLLGAGEMSALAARHLRQQGAKLTITNRSIERAELLAKELDGVAQPLEALPHLLTEADIVISSTSAQRWVLTYDTMIGIVRARRNRPLFLIDLAVPRDIEPRVNTIDNVYLYDVDDMERVLERNRVARQKEAEVALRLVDKEADTFVRRLKQRDVVPTIVALRQHFQDVAEAEFERFASSQKDLDEKSAKAVRALTNRLINKLLHQPVVNLKRASEHGGGDEWVEVVNGLFELEDGTQAEEQPDENVVNIDSKRSKAQ